VANRELQQQIRSLIQADTAAERKILTIAAGSASTAAAAAADFGFCTDNEGILHLEAEDDSGAPNPWTGGTFRLYFRDDALSGDWKAGEIFAWDFTASETITVNLQGKKYVFLQVVTKTDALSAASFWGGVNTVEGA